MVRQKKSVVAIFNSRKCMVKKRSFVDEYITEQMVINIINEVFVVIFLYNCYIINVLYVNNNKCLFDLGPLCVPESLTRL